MSKTNCVNCGHGKDPDSIKCPFCGTTYLDFTSIDLSGNAPCILTLKMPGANVLTQMKAYPILEQLEIRPEFLATRDVHGRLHRALLSNNISCDIKFVCVD